MVGTTFYRLSSRLSDDVDDDDGSRQRSLTFASITVGGPPTFKGGTNLKDETHHHDQLRPPPTRRFTGRDNGMQDVAAAAAAAALAPPLAPPLPPGEGCTLGEPGGFLPQDISAGDCVTTACLRDEWRVGECEKRDYRAGYTSFHTSVHLQQPQQQQQWQHHQRGKRYVAGTPGKSRLHHPPSLPLTTLPGVFLSPSIFPSSDVTGMESGIDPERPPLDPHSLYSEQY
ncbi:hypothetical protein ALC57_15966 [Trachymyrmex cornetzi]|uniref:Uncharacterized protein n=1 Tax=Trachymyrmex cornetzi TaxID=471704 RepID=A0A195DG07_9HYME|nr:hypothetical protein ALC57_15966 [Trachymyrmex cornetzi]